MEDLALFFRLLWGTVIYRPYVYAFFTAFVVFATYHLGWKRMVTFMVSTYLIAYFSEYSSTRNGFPFGPYTYFDETRTRELWISNVPFWDSLSFVFLSYFSYVLSAVILSKPDEIQHGDWSGNRSKLTPWMGGVVMMLLDVVIDPVALQGEKWFLGKIYNYPYEGFYFGVTAANFAGWFFVGFASQWVFQRYLRHVPWCRAPWRRLDPRFVWAIYAVYAGVFAFNLGITIMIEDYTLAKASAAVSGLTLLFLGVFLKKKTAGAEKGMAPGQDVSCAY